MNIPYDADILAKLKQYNNYKFDISPINFQMRPQEILNFKLFYELEEYLKVNIN